MRIQEILKLPDNEIQKYIPELAAIYKKETNRIVCQSCRGDLIQMIQTLKNLYNMSNFQLKGLNPYYRIQKGQAGYISNSVMTDEIAIEFLQKGDFESRLNLFSKYPDDVKELVQMPANLSEIVKGVDEDCCDDTEEPCAECKEAKRTELREMGIKDLKKAYPEVKYTPHLGMNKDAFIDLILQA